MKAAGALKVASLLAAGVAAGVGLATAATHFAYGSSAPDFRTANELSRFGLAFERVRDNYLSEPEDRQLIENAIGGMLSNLDAHSSYFDPKTFAAMQTKAAGAYGGIGVVIGLKDGAIDIVSVVPSTPAARAGIKMGDELIAINGAPMHGHALDDVSSRMRGKVGTDVELMVGRTNAKPFAVSLTREAIEVERLTWHREGDIGYIRIVAFSDRTEPDMRKAVADLKHQIGPGLKGYVVDLRNNGGGVLQASIDVADDFLDSGEIVSVRGRDAQSMERYDAHPGDIADGKPIVVLINGGTASASEIVAGALQDHHRATILGSLSFGKGSVQTVMPLDNGAGGALHMTTARYYTPSGRSIQVTGIVPDMPVADGAGVPQYQREAELPHHLLAEGPAAKPVGSPVVPMAGHAYLDFQLTMALSYLHKSLAARSSVPEHA
jgi:carboxyl-terminal processing protease